MSTCGSADDHRNTVPDVFDRARNGNVRVVKVTRRAGVTERHVRQQYILIKSHCPNVDKLRRDQFLRWSIGTMPIGETCREAYQFLVGLRAGLLAAPFLNQPKG